MKDRIKQIRKIKGFSQTEFGKIVGVSRDVISNYEMGRVEPPDLFINHICSTFGISEDWLRTGNGEMFISTPDTILDELITAHNLNSKEAAIIKAFLSLSPAGRAGVIEYAETFSKFSQSQPATTSRDDKIDAHVRAKDKIIENEQAKVNK